VRKEKNSFEIHTTISRFGIDGNLSFMISYKVTERRGCCPLYWIAVKIGDGFNSKSFMSVK